jgi:hypothetical protein
MELETVREYLNDGWYDSQLDELLRMVESRQTYLAERDAASLVPGDQIVVTRIRPKYLEGAELTVKSVRGKKVEATMNHTHSDKYFEGMSVTIPVPCVRKVGC